MLGFCKFGHILRQGIKRLKNHKIILSFDKTETPWILLILSRAEINIDLLGYPDGYIATATFKYWVSI